jgi:hypothetical protein
MTSGISLFYSSAATAGASSDVVERAGTFLRSRHVSVRRTADDGPPVLEDM